MASFHSPHLDDRRFLQVKVNLKSRGNRALLGALAASVRSGRGAAVINISSDAAVNAYAGWGAYGASKAALRHLTSIWAAEAKADGISFLSLDPGDMDTPLHALAVPASDPGTLRRPRDAATEIVGALIAHVSSAALHDIAERRDRSWARQAAVRQAAPRQCRGRAAGPAACDAGVAV